MGGASANPWDFLQPNDVARFGEIILDREEQRRWSSALFLGGLSYMWQQSSVLRDLIFLKLGLKTGDRVLLFGEALEGSKFDRLIKEKIGSSELVCIDIIERARNAMVEKRYGRTGKLGTWNYDYCSQMQSESFDAVLILQGVGHSDDWREAGREFVRVLRPGAPILLAEIGFGPQFFAALELDLHVDYIFKKIVTGRGRELGDAAYYSIADLTEAFAGLLEDVDSFSWRSADLFWGRKRRT